MSDPAQHADPPSYVCPLSLKLMDDPVMDLCAHNFEREAIATWLQNHKCCPISRKPLTEQDLAPNHTLAERIEKWKWLQENDGIMWKEGDHDMALRDEDATHNNSSDDDLDSTVDGHASLEGSPGPSIRRPPDMEQGIFRKKKRGGRRRQSVLPAQFMLLPQEREVLEIVRMRAADRRAKRRQRIVWGSVIGTLVAVGVIAVALLCARLFRNKDDDG